MSKITEEIRQGITKLTNDRLKAVLLAHLSENAENQTQLFTRHHPYDRPIPNFNRANYVLANGLSYNLPLNMVFAFAPAAVCKEVTDALLQCPDAELAELLSSVHQHHSDARADEWVMETVMKHAPAHSRMLISQKIKSLNSKQITDVLFSDAYPQDFNSLLKVFNFKDETATVYLIEALGQLDKKLLFEFFKTSPFPPTYEALIHFFSENPPEKIALAVLNLLYKYDGSYLSSLVFGGGYFISSRSNLLHGIFEFQSEKVISELFSFLLKNFQINDIKTLLTYRRTSGSNHTPLELAFQRKDNRIVALRIAQKLYKEPLLRPLLTNVSISQFNSIMHLAALNNNAEVVAFFAQQPDASVDHGIYSTSTISSKGMLQLAQEAGQEEVKHLLLALPIYKFIYPDNSQQMIKSDLTWVKELVKQYPDIIHCRWEENKTLLSHAAIKGISPLVSLLLAAGALPEPDINGCTAIDEALKNHHLSTIRLFTRAANHNEFILVGLTNSFLKLSQPAPSYQDLQRILQYPQQEQTFFELLESYSFQRNDSFIFLLIEIAKLHSETNNKLLWQILQKFVQDSLDKLQNEFSYLQDNAIQLQLIILLFSMTPSNFLTLFSSMNLNEKAQKTLQLVLSRGLVQPAIFSRLSIADHQLYFKFLTELQPHESNPLHSIATIHFQDSRLTLLPPQILKELATSLTCASLLLLCEQRLNPSLIVLTIDKLLATTPINQEKLGLLFAQLDKELQWLAKEKSPDDAELSHMLNVTSHPQIKQFIKVRLQEETSPLSQRIRLLFTHHQSTKVFLPDSLLYDIFMEYAQDFKTISASENQQAFTALVTSITPTEITKLVTNLQNIFHPRLLISELLTPTFLTIDNLEESSFFSSWIYNLENKKQRLGIAALISHVDQLHEQTQHLCLLIKNEECTLLKNSLQQLAGRLDEVASHLFQLHLGQSTLLVDEQLNSMLKKLEFDFDNTIVAFKQAKENPSLKIKYSVSLAEFEHLISCDEVLSLCNQIILVCEQIDTDNNKYMVDTNKALFIDSETGVPEKLFNTEKSFVELAKTARTQAPQAKQILDRCNQSFVSGILANPDRAQLLNVLFHLIFTCRSTTAKDLVLRNMPDLLNTTDTEQWQQVNHRINELLFLRAQISPILIDLQLLNFSEFNPSDLLTVFYQIDESRLAQFVEFCAQAQLSDLHTIASYVLVSKKQQIPLNILQIQNTFTLPPNLCNWLQHRMETLDSYSSEIMSFKVLGEGLPRQGENVLSRLKILNKAIEEFPLNPSPSAIHMLIASYQPILQNTNTITESRAFILSLSNLLKATTVQVINDSFCQVSKEILNQLIPHCLTGLNSDDKSYAYACRHLLTTLCQLQSGSNTQTLELIKSHLGQQDLYLLGDVQLISIATNILATTENDLMSSTINGIWIQRLLTSPRFVAASSPKVIQALTERYRFISLTLKQDEFETLNQWLKTKLAFYDHHHDSLNRLEQSILSDPARREHLLKKRERLLSFRADDSIRALFNQLEDNCIELKTTEPETAESALDVLYSHYNNSLTSLRSDLLFKVADFIIGKASRGRGDIDIAQDTLLRWLTRYLPHKNFEQTELTRKSLVSLHNEEGDKIGFVNEANQAMTFVDDEPCSLLEVKGICPGLPLYDDNRCLMGSLTATGEVKRENLFQKNTSALLVAKVPSEQLGKSPAALELLMTDIFTENTLGHLYLNSEIEKQPWIETQVHLHLAEAQKAIHKDNLQIVVKQHSSEAIFSLLENMKSQDNAAQLFEAILNDETQRNELFNPKRQSALFAFFKKSHTHQLFAHYLLNHYNSPWFKDGLQLFAHFAQSTGKPELLIASLQVLQERTYQQKLISETTYDCILTTLIGSEDCTKILWKSFLNTSEDAKLKEIDHDLADDLTSFFYKHHCMPLIKSVNEQNSWSQSSQYRLLLLILARQRKQIFQKNELRYSEKFAWSSLELQQISRFVKRHFRQPDSPDNNFSVGKKLIGELVFRCANFGQTQLFYDNQGQFDVTTAGTILERSYFHAIAAREYLPPQIKKTIHDIVSTFKGWFDNQHQKNEQLTELLKDNQALIDWKQLSEESWSVSNSSTTLPIISAYLLNYSGPKEPLIQLIKDYFSAKPFQKDPNALRFVTQIMAKFPQRSVSACLFSTLEEIFSQNPLLVDNTILNHMAQFYTNRHLKKTLQSPQLEIHLVKHFGLQKKYSLVQRCCELLMGPQQEKSVDKLLQKINLEAKIESQLSGYLSTWYFSIVRFIKRCWYYGFGGHKNSSNLVSYCDTQPDYQSPVEPIDKIHTPILGGQTIASQMETVKKLKTIRKRYDQFLEKQSPQTLEPTKAKTLTGLKTSNMGLFVHPVSTKEENLSSNTHGILVT